jgi:hyaluronan synthase
MIGLAAATLVATAGWALKHAQVALHPTAGKTPLALAYYVTFAFLAIQVLLYTAERPRRASRRNRRYLDSLTVAILVPLYNEDPAVVRASIGSMLAQTRLPQAIVVIDDGSTAEDYSAIARWAADAASAVHVELQWWRTVNRGKRHAQVAGAALASDADVFVTVDSDTMLDSKAIEQLLLPFADEKVQSVAGLVVAANSQTNLLTRFTDVWFACTQLVDRSALSVMSSVLVNCGGLAGYRNAVIRDNVEGYLNETFFGRPVPFSDDSLLTTYAKLAGRTVQQPSAICFTMMPDRMNHHLRQYLRWMRGSTIRSWWRFKYLPLSSVAYWMHVINWVETVLGAILFALLYFWYPFVEHQVSPFVLLVPLLIGYAHALRYLLVARSDVRLRGQLMNWLLSPVATVWACFVLRPLRWYGAATCLRTGWGTRQVVEVYL